MSRPPRIRFGGDCTALDARTVHAGVDAHESMVPGGRRITCPRGADSSVGAMGSSRESAGGASSE